MFARYNLSPTFGTRLYTIANQIRIKNEIYKSVSSPITKSIDHFVKMNDGAVGAIELFVIDERSCFLLLQKYEIVHQKYHFREVKRTEQRTLYPWWEIKETMIYLKFGTIEVLTKEPNRYEKFVTCK